MVSTGVATPESFGFDNPETTPPSIPTNPATPPQGTVKWFNPDKGYGFIQPDDGNKDVFVHIKQVESAGMHSLNEGQKIAFDVVANPKNGKASAENLHAV